MLLGSIWSIAHRSQSHRPPAGLQMQHVFVGKRIVFWASQRVPSVTGADSSVKTQGKSLSHCRAPPGYGPPVQQGRPLKRRAGRSPSPSGSYSRSGSYSSYSSSGSEGSKSPRQRPPGAMPPPGLCCNTTMLLYHGTCLLCSNDKPVLWLFGLRVDSVGHKLSDPTSTTWHAPSQAAEGGSKLNFAHEQ